MRLDQALRAGLFALVLALVLVQPWVAAVWSVSGDRWYDQAATPLVLFALVGVLLLALVLAREDLWLGLFCAYVALSAYMRPSLSGMATLEYVVAGALLLLGVRRLASWAPPWCPRLTGIRVLVAALVAAGCFQVLYTLGQLAGYDPLWFGATARGDLRPMGTIRASNLLGAYLAVVGLLAPVVLLPVFLIGVVLSQSVVAFAAFAVGLWVRFRRWRPAGLLLLVAVGLMAVYQLVLVRHLGRNVAYRWSTWVLAVKDWLTTAPVFGWGFGAWGEGRGPRSVSVLSYPSERALHAHNEVVQLAHEGGLVALALLGGWLWVHRAAWRTPYAGALAALALTVLGTFPFHLATTAAVGLIVMGLATASPPLTPA